MAELTVSESQPARGDRLVFYAAMVRALARAAARRAIHGQAHPDWPWLYELAAEALRVAIRDHHRVATELVRQQRSPISRALAREVRLECAKLAGLAVESHVPRKLSAHGVTILYLHGGGFATCSPAAYRHMLARLAATTGARCVAPDYRLAPRYPFPAALEDALACYRALRAAAPSALFVAGDSAGGALCLALLLKLREAGEPLPQGTILLSPWVDLTLGPDALATHAQHDYLPAERLILDARLYAGDASLFDPLVSPIYADMSGFPPILIQTGEWEIFREQNLRLAARAREAGVEVAHEIVPGMLHAFPCFTGILPQADIALAAIGRFVRSHATPGAAGTSTPA